MEKWSLLCVCGFGRTAPFAAMLLRAAEWHRAIASSGSDHVVSIERLKEEAPQT